MNITGPQLLAEYRRAVRVWPFVPVVESAFGLPRLLLFAVGSRETNLTNEVGDGGHGHGVWQLDNRSHTIPPGFDGNVHLQAATAARMLRGLLAGFAHAPDPLRCALAAYNAGAGTVGYNLAHGLDVDTGTAGGDYSADTYARLLYLQGAVPVSLSSQDVDRIAAAVTDKLLAEVVHSPDGRAGGTVGHCLSRTFELVYQNHQILTAPHDTAAAATG